MPLNTTPNPLQLSSYEDIKEKFVIFYASRDESGTMWCPDCREVEDLIARTFAPSDGPSGLIVYVGQRPEWKTDANVFRSAPWRIRSIPTVVKLENATEVDRLVEDEIVSGLAGLVRSILPPSSRK
ncbi:hypothetical protein F5148DRAFT_1153314 [Russula earlei]|uniref:Uncharacterized protein n=1 Tax=Russula earlei TaxID=71964 RepID=A0ACC0TTS8_9AGAM|nr:hypothetical protein F5148DRAFT_1153314 [Russula earlei]